MAITKIQSESLNLADTYDFTGTVTGAGGVMTPAFSVYLSGNVSLSNNTYTKLTFDSEEYDSGSVFASNKFTPGVVGKYVISAGASIDSDQSSNCNHVKLSIYKNGSALRVVEPHFAGNPIRRTNPTFSYLINVTSKHQIILKYMLIIQQQLLVLEYLFKVVLHIHILMDTKL